MDPPEDGINFFIQGYADHALHARASRLSGEARLLGRRASRDPCWAVDPVDTGKRAILDREGERGFGVEVERQRQRGADRAAMRDGDYVASGIGLGGHGPLPGASTQRRIRRGEMFASSAGETATVLAAIVLFCGIGLALFGIVALGEWAIQRWYGGEMPVGGVI